MDKPFYILWYKATIRWFEVLDRQGWLIVLIVGMCLSFLCLRGTRQPGT
jgi:hypothetical protein